MEKFLIILLSIMLVVLLVFNAFGIAYNENNFFGTILTVEHGLGEFSQNFLKVFKEVKELFISFYQQTITIYDATLGKFFEWFENLTGLSVFETYLSFFRTVSNFVKDITLHFQFFSRYGLHLFNSSWENEYNFFLIQIHNPDMYTDYSIREGWDWSKFDQFMQAYLYGANNQYSYLLQSQNGTNISNYVDFSNPCDTYFIRISSFIPKTCTDKNFTYYISTVDTDMAKNYMTFLDPESRAKNYVDGVTLPVFDSNITISSNGVSYELIGLEFDVNTKSYTYSFSVAGWFFVPIFVFESSSGDVLNLTYKEFCKQYAYSGVFLGKAQCAKYDYVYTPST